MDSSHEREDKCIRKKLNMGDCWQTKRQKHHRWIFTTKHKANGSLDRYKDRLVANAYTQIYAIDHEETFSPVAKMNVVWVVLALTTNFRWALHQLDVKNVFLHRALEVYMKILLEYETRIRRNKVCLLKKALYGLKQSPRARFGRFTNTMVP